MFYRLLTAIGALCLILTSSVAVAAPVTYDFHGDFTAPATGSFSGSVVYDPDTDKVTSGAVSVTDGLAANGIPKPSATLPFEKSDSSSVTFSAPPLVPNGVVVRLNVVRDVNNRSLILQSLVAGYCNADCTAIIIGQPFTRQGPVILGAKPVPTLSEWAMIILGLTLAGSAAVYIQRRRIRG